MKIYLAGAEAKDHSIVLTECEQKNRLLSYYYIKQMVFFDLEFYLCKGVVQSNENQDRRTE